MFDSVFLQMCRMQNGDSDGIAEGNKSNHEEVVIGCEHDLHPHLIASSVELKICLCLEER